MRSDSTHPLVLMLDDLATGGLAFATIHLDNMCYENVAALVSDSLSLTRLDVSELAHIIYAKTHGNAFFTIEFLESAVRRRPASVRARTLRMGVGRCRHPRQANH